ncbi:MAG: hypothetical protein IKM42_05245 [Clostridia bacterium]|nr:hypothetical protein [Clostridia bacterium]
MGILIAFNLFLILIVTGFLVAVKKWVQTPRAQYAVLLIAGVVTVLVHYSSFFYYLAMGTALEYVRENLCLILPLYPCNILMWCALIYGFIGNKNSKAALFLSDFLFWFGIFATMAGMFANFDFLANPTLTDYEVVKSILSHATLLFNILLIPVLGYLRPRFWRNVLNIATAIVFMCLIGLYCNLTLEVLVSYEMALDMNSMFLLQSPFAPMPFLRGQIIAPVAFVLYFILFTVIDIIRMPRGARWFDKVLNALRNKKSSARL